MTASDPLVAGLPLPPPGRLTVHSESTPPRTELRATSASAVSSPGDFVIPRSGAAAAALLDAATMLEALSLPATAASFSLPSSLHSISRSDAHHVEESCATAAAARATFTRMCTTALPLLFDFAEQQLVATEENPSQPPTPMADVEDAVQCLCSHLNNIARATRRDGRRHVAALPPPVAAALWDRVLPALHAQVMVFNTEPHKQTERRQKTRRQSEEGNAPPSGDAHTDVGPAAAAASAVEKTIQEEALPPTTMPVSVAAALKPSYLALRRALALHTRAVASLLPPDILAMVLTRLFQCHALSDDIIGPVVADVIEKQTRERSRLAVPASTATTVGGTIATLQQRVLRLGTVPSGDDALMGTCTFRGASAVTMARLLGKTAIPGHHQLHRFFHLELLPEVTRVLRDTAARRHEVINGEESVLTAVQPGVDALLDLTRAFRHYAVSGEAVQHLTTLWQLYFTAAATTTTITWDGCAAVLHALSSAVPTASSRSQRRQARQLPRHPSSSSHGRQDQLLLRVAEEDYYPLVEEVCARVRQLSAAAVASAASGTSSGNIAAEAGKRGRMGVEVGTPSPSELLGVLRMLLRVNSPHWADTYEALATAIVLQLASQLSVANPTTKTAAATVSAWWESVLPLSDTQRTVTALLRRNSLIPDHALHRVLLRRILYAPEALTDAAVATTALLGLEVMIPTEEGNTGEATSSSSPPVSSTDATSGTQTSADLIVQMLPSDDVTITAQDRTRALQLLRRYGRSMSPTAFVAGLCVAPIHQLPLLTQTALVNHLSAVASSISPAYLVKGMAAVTRQLSPTAVDDVSLQRWYSRFTARDVVRRVDGGGCAVLLDILASYPQLEANCALAKQAITRQIGVALLRTTDAAGNGSGAALTLEQLPHVISALRRASVFLPPYFSRVCRLLLGQVESAPLGDFLIPFYAVAEEFMRRQQQEAQASVFKDVWELLRGRVLDQVTTLSLEEICTALNAFAALDVTDRALFSVLVYRLWTCVQQEARGATNAAAGEKTRPASIRAATATIPTMVPPTSSSHARVAEKGVGEVQEVTFMSQTEVADASSTAAASREAEARNMGQLGQHITLALSPSAVGVVVTTLCARDYDDTAAARSGSGDAMTATMLPWMLLALRSRHAELYPIDVVHVLPSLVQQYANAATPPSPSASSTARFSPTSPIVAEEVPDVVALLHAAYDACRITFLSMYAILPGPAALPAAEVPKDASAAATATTQDSEQKSRFPGSTLTAEEVQLIAEQRAAWTPAVKLSVQVVPRSWFATLLLALSSTNIADVDVGLACVERACTRRVCGAQLPVDQLVDLCLTICWLFRVAESGAMHRPRDEEVRQTSSATKKATSSDSTDAAASGEAEAEAPPSSTSATAWSAAPVLRTGMATVLSALWFRSDELNTPQIHALLRCLRDTYGDDRVDADFVERLEAQMALIRERKKKAAATAAGAVVAADNVVAGKSSPNTEEANSEEEVLMKDQQQHDGTEAIPAPPPEVAQMHADDLFSVM
jgi:hypothetical protein